MSLSDYPKEILIVVPVFNEDKFLHDLLHKLLLYAPGSNILVVDDGSSDGTPAIIERYPVISLTHSVNLGKGKSLLDAIDFAYKNRFTWIITLDGDGQHDPIHIPSFIEKIRKDDTDVIIGYRQNWDKKMPIERQLANGFSSILVSFFTGRTRIHDSQSGYRAFRVRILQRIKFQETGFQFESEMLVKLGKSGARFAEIPITTHYGKEKSKVNPFVDTFKFIKLIVKSFW